MATIKKLLRDKAKNLLLKEIEKSINNGSMKLPSEHSMVENMGISRVTLRSALAELELTGKIVRTQGRGTFVNPVLVRINQDINVMKAYDQIKTQDGLPISLKTLPVSVVKTPEFLKMEDKFNSEYVLKSPKVYFSNGKLVAFCIDYLPSDYIYEKENIDNYKESIFKYLYKEYGIIIKSGKMEIETISKAEFLNEFVDFEVPSSLLKISSFDYDEKLNPIVFSVEYINTYLLKFTGVRYRDIDYTKYKE